MLTLGLCRGLTISGAFLFATVCFANGPFFVTYTSVMEEVRTLEITNKTVTGAPEGINGFAGSVLEFEYGATSWWTTEFYLDGQATKSDSTLFTGYRWENRFRVLPHPRWLHPVLYVEFEDLNGADKSLLEVVGHDTIADFKPPARDVRRIRERELDNKLILDGEFKHWIIAGNFIAERNLSDIDEPWEFGYAVGAGRPLARSARACGLCLASLVAGVEAYGGLGTTDDFGLHHTSHYIAPTLLWSPGHGTTVRLSPNFGLNSASARFLFRFGVSYEIEGFGRAVQNLFRKAW